MSITLAAEDLHLTQSAVSRQVRTLEERLGVKLLMRGHRTISLTVGRRNDCFRCGDEAIKQLQDVIGTIQVGLAARPVTIASSIGLAGFVAPPPSKQLPNTISECRCAYFPPANELSDPP